MENNQNEKILACYPSEVINKVLEITNQIEVKGVTNVTGLAAIMNLLSAPKKTIKDDDE